MTGIVWNLQGAFYQYDHEHTHLLFWVYLIIRKLAIIHALFSSLC